MVQLKKVNVMVCELSLHFCKVNIHPSPGLWCGEGCLSPLGQAGKQGFSLPFQGPQYEGETKECKTQKLHFSSLALEPGKNTRERTDHRCCGHLRKGSPDPTRAPWSKGEAGGLALAGSFSEDTE